jgi:hypothetical protein
VKVVRVIFSLCQHLRSGQTNRRSSHWPGSRTRRCAVHLHLESVRYEGKRGQAAKRGPRLPAPVQSLSSSVALCWVAAFNLRLLSCLVSLTIPILITYSITICRPKRLCSSARLAPLYTTTTIPHTSLIFASAVDLDTLHSSRPRTEPLRARTRAAVSLGGCNALSRRRRH